MTDKKCPKCDGTGIKAHLRWELECMYCDGRGGVVDAFFTCGVDGCGARQDVPGAMNSARYLRDKGHLVSHYRWNHADLVGTKIYTSDGHWHYDYKPISDEIGPTLTYEGEVTTWAQLCEIEGRV